MGPDVRTVPASPRVSGEVNTVQAILAPRACWRMDDLLFDFGLSFVRPDAVDEFGRLDLLMGANPGSKLALFGHADPVGDDAGNKVLSGRRAMAVYGMLVRRPDLWERLYSRPAGSDRWGQPQLDVMSAAVGGPPGLPYRTAGERQALFQSYMDVVCRTLGAAPYRLDPATQFLGGGADPDGRGDYHGCSEFNPVLMFSAAEDAAYRADSDKTARDLDNQPNRRVVGLLFASSVRIDLARWPCPAALAGPAPCRARFYSRHATRRRFQAMRRTANADHDTFACRFFDRMSSGSACNGTGRLVTMQLCFQRYPGKPGAPDQAGVDGLPFRFNVVGRSERTGVTGPDGSVVVTFEDGESAVLEVLGTHYELRAGPALEPPRSLAGVQRRLDLLGYQPDAPGSAMAAATDRAILQYQADAGVDPDGDQVIDTAVPGGVPSAGLANRLRADAGG